uniref:Uncharacterized protein n=1 Tax=Anopheles coluzzii TaxID=1518534 RepID=A0A8W7PJS7_ANOCL
MARGRSNRNKESDCICIACATIDVTSDAVDGTMSVLLCLASFSNATTYFSATLSDAALRPCSFASDSATIFRLFARASASAIMAAASPFARLISSCFCASEARMRDCRLPSATLMSAARTPSDSRIAARLRRSASTCICIASCTRLGSLMSRISYRRQEMPHASLALLIDSTMLMLSDSRSRNTLSSDILPSSERIVVWASWVMANSGSSTPYDARYGSRMRRYSTPSMLSVTLSDVMADCFGTSIAISFRLCTYFTRSTTGSRTFRPGSRMR